MEYIEDKDKLINAIKNDYTIINTLDNVEKNDYILLHTAIISYLGNNIDKTVSDNILEFTKRFSNDLLNTYDGDFFRDFKENYKDSIFFLPTNEFTKILDLFSEDNIKLDKININNYIEAYLQNKFNKDYGNQLVIHKNILESVRLGHKQEVVAYLKSLKGIFNYDSFLQSVGYTEESFLRDLYRTTGKAKDVLKQLCDRTLDKLRTNYLNENKDSVYNSLELNRYYDKNKLVNKVINDINYTDLVTFIVNNGIIDSNYFKASYLDQEMKVFINNGLSDVFNGKKRHINEYSKNDLRLFSILMNYLYENHYLEKLVDVTGIPYTNEEYPRINNKDILNIIFKLDKEIVNEDLEGLNKFLTDTKIIGLGNGFNKLFNEMDINIDNNLVANLLNNFSEIRKNNPKNVFDYINFSKNLGNSDKKLRMLFLNDEAYLAYILNKAPYNNVELTSKERNESIYDIAKNLYLRKELTVPAIDKDYTINKHKYHVTIGNFHDFSQLALGELTSSCVRNGSMFANDLYRYALLNKNGFNVIIRENNKIVGKVTGFRVGNTIIFNQLKDNFYPEVKNLVEVMKKLSNDFVTLTKKNDPIKNILIGFSLSLKGEKTRDLSKDLNKIFDNMDRIYTDIDYTKMCLLNSHLAPFKFHYVHDTYPALRDEVKFETDKDKMNMIMNHYHILNSLIKGILPNEIKIENFDLSNIDELYYGQDYYVGIKDGQISNYLIFDNRGGSALLEIGNILEKKQSEIIKK